MAHVRGQDQEAFDEAGDQHHGDGQRDREHQRAEAPADSGQREEGDHRGQGGGQHRLAHTKRRLLGGFQRACAPAGEDVGVLAHHDSVVDDDPQADDEREQGHHVEAHADDIHEPQRGSHCHGNAYGYPQSGPCGQEQEQEQEHQHQPDHCIVDQDREAVGDHVRQRAGQRGADALGHGLADRLQHLGGGFLHRQRIPAGKSDKFQSHGGHAGDRVCHEAVLVAQVERSHLAQAEGLAIRRTA